ncbi:MAG: hypothetical protein ACHQX1_00450 [Candidatus Micrarchaeales archaeon]
MPLLNGRYEFNSRRIKSFDTQGRTYKANIYELENETIDVVISRPIRHRMPLIFLKRPDLLEFLITVQKTEDIVTVTYGSRDALRKKFNYEQLVLPPSLRVNLNKPEGKKQMAVFLLLRTLVENTPKNMPRYAMLRDKLLRAHNDFARPEYVKEKADVKISSGLSQSAQYQAQESSLPASAPVRFRQFV